MFRSLYRIAVPYRPVAFTQVKPFHSSFVVSAKGGKKAKKGGKSEPEESTDVPSVQDIINLDEVKNKFESVLEKFNRKANEVKLGKTNPKIFDHLDIKLSDGEAVKFNQIAQTQIKGRNLMITVFDPDQILNIINSILDSNLNMNPVHDKLQEILKVPLPPITSETKKEAAKVLKAEFEKFKNNNSNSLNSVRTDYKQKLKKLNKKSDAEMKVIKDFENLHKQYLEKLNTVYKTSEKAILN